MEKSKAKGAFLPVLILFLLLSALFSVFGGTFSRLRIDPDVLIIGNLILFVATAVSFYFYQRSMMNNKVHVFMGMIYGGMFFKLMICLFSALIYIMTAGKQVNKGGIFACMFLYFLYSFIEMMILMKISKQNKNG